MVSTYLIHCKMAKNLRSMVNSVPVGITFRLISKFNLIVGKKGDPQIFFFFFKKEVYIYVCEGVELLDIMVCHTVLT